MPARKQIKYGREYEDAREKIREGLELTPAERQSLSLALSLHVLEVIKARGLEPLEEEGIVPRKKRIIELRKKDG